ncbi:4-hydroxythreonine-4-phosphate dehydrogenase PdxA [Runella sp. MFBS21]|uniref:4-hydroxythreonine-4-phosphate dehydrogenase PdxA n=1 Tax=Runella sp. MFBS21 TaxID=3034018 RepID=UPI0023F9628A|nr:4-hydroxythreonine-4-phosphate dehydrogenase PdxA [Runella sp. MFBS21]MDF7818799.1 4-hydroxythreonine-4-phosphate dehydrogenase PdxA [Runella sp. MFBS21]
MSEPVHHKPIIGITLGDYNGIGPEVILKVLYNNQLNRICTPVIYGSMRILNRYRNQLDMKDWNLFGAPKIDQINPKLTNVITCWQDPQEEIQPGKITPEAGKGAFESLKRALEDLKAGRLDGLVTAPINKSNIQNDEFKFPGHTEYLAEAFEVSEPLMFMVSDTLRVGVVSGHISLREVADYITKDKIVVKLQAMLKSLREDFGTQKPKIAVLGLNPHAGENGLLGKEEEEIISPAIQELKNKGLLIYGPFPADGFFAAQSYRKYDAILAMYHDQGLTPFKTIAFNDGVNFTAGLPIVRTSPDHGTAYDIAGKNLADETSMRQAIYTACDVIKNRYEQAELVKNALKKNPVVEKMTAQEEK